MKNNDDKITKLLLISPHTYENLLKNSQKSSSVLEESEKIKKILMSNDIKNSHKLFLIHEILNKTNFNQNLTIPSNEKIIHPTNETSAGTQTDDLISFKPDVINRKKNQFKPSLNSSQQTLNIEEHNNDDDEKFNSSLLTNTTNSSTPRKGRKSLGLDKSKETIYSVNDTSSFESVANEPLDPRYSSIYDNDGDELDLSEEKKSFLKNVEEATGRKDVRDLKFFNLSQDDKSFVNATDEKTGYSYHLPKPKAFRIDLDMKREKGIIKKRPKSLAHSLRSLKNDSTQSFYKNDGKSFLQSWSNYENIRLFPKKK